ncbi:hypothetical protein AZI86_13370 [Bdellovibrio bacteriovorus]|uniref:Enzyme of sugar metabolism n=1 Tax=Bdellovibrio bacteriovorus TaxID=959 RepID=A0A150WJ40_BDEBC|nr:hypothetical protein [Bdellovibrio bacteriovorus]KYG63807.1 hypothetical protein AZI86_13370 [Bdellovibrio bacteriovorus]
MNNGVKTAENSWGIIGLGWLGSSLASYLAQQNISSWGTTTKDFKWESDRFPNTECDVLFLNTPPLVNLSPADFVNKIPDHAARRILFVSSISVYGGCDGVVNEDTSVQPQTASARWLVEVEDRLLKRFKDYISVIRAGGLIGEDRHPVKSLAQSQKPVAGKSLINLIHREDLVRIIYAVSKMENSPKILNAVCPYHPTKSDYYTASAKRWKVALPLFELSMTENKVVDSLYLEDLYPQWIHGTL